ncbi:MAG: hypothetical protein Q9188_004685 [Gyalolechia gomerana]
MAYYQPPEVEGPYFVDVLRGVEATFTTQGNFPFLELPAVTILQSIIDQPAPSGQRTQDEWRILYTDAVERWLEDQNIDIEADDECLILPCDTPDFLILLYDMFNRVFFNGELPSPLFDTADEGRLLGHGTNPTDQTFGQRIVNGFETDDYVAPFRGDGIFNPQIPVYDRDPLQQPGLKIAWADFLFNAVGLTHYDPIQIQILREPPGKQYLSGTEALQVISVLLHEMCHVYLSLNITRYESCDWGKTGHGNAFLFLAWLVENAANKTYGFLGRFDLNQIGSWFVEERAWRGKENT